MKAVFLSVIIIFLCTCKENASSGGKTDKQTYFDSLENKNVSLLKGYNFLQLNDTAKWLLYALHCDDSCTEGRGRYKQSLEKIPLCYLKLKLSYVEKRRDTLSLLYNFLYNDSVFIERINRGNDLTNGIMFDTKKINLLGI